jgi:phage-related protein
MSTFTVPPDYGAQLSDRPRVLLAQFGDGYAQRALDGINAAPEEWSLTFSARTPAERDTILAFLEARNGVEPFTWTSPRGTVGKWVCPEWTFSPINAAVNTITARFVQDYSPG